MLIVMCPLCGGEYYLIIPTSVVAIDGISPSELPWPILMLKICEECSERNGLNGRKIKVVADDDESVFILMDEDTAEIIEL